LQVFIRVQGNARRLQSSLNASIGLMPAARLDGSSVAKNPTKTMTAMLAAKIAGFRGSTPKSTRQRQMFPGGGEV
jgi:hypothetical protein